MSIGILRLKVQFENVIMLSQRSCDRFFGGRAPGLDNQNEDIAPVADNNGDSEPIFPLEVHHVQIEASQCTVHNGSPSS